MIIQRKLRVLILGVLLIWLIFIFGSIVLNYNISPTEIYKVENENLIEDGSFERFNQTPGDCCVNNHGDGSIFALKSNISVEGKYSLNLISNNHCACISKKINGFYRNEFYFISLYFWGNSPYVCVSSKCMPGENINLGNDWKYYNSIFSVNNTDSLSVFLFANSDGIHKVTNLYDDLQVRKLITIENPREYQYNTEEEYIFKAESDNKVKGEMISDTDAKTGEAYFIVKGIPHVTIKFPWSDVLIVIIIIFVIVRLMFKRGVR